jgi:hypothetical protein
MAYAKIVTGTRLELGIPIDAKGYYPAVIEYGTSKQAAKPFMRVALAQLRTHVIKKTGDYIDENIKKNL